MTPMHRFLFAGLAAACVAGCLSPDQQADQEKRQALAAIFRKLQAYAAEHDGQFPQAISQVGSPGLVAYVNRGDVLAYHPLLNSRDQVFVLFRDGTIEEMRQIELRPLLREGPAD